MRRVFVVAFLLTLSAANVSHAQFVDRVPGEVPVSPGVLTTVRVSWPPVAAGNGETFLALSANHEGVRAARVSALGVPIDVPARVVSINSANAPGVTWTGAHYLAAWLERPVVKVARISAAGEILDHGGKAVASVDTVGLGSGDTIKVASTGDRTLVVVSTWRRLGAFLLDGEGNLIRQVPIPHQPEVPAGAAVASSGDQFMVVWHEGPGNRPSTISGWRVRSDGEPLDAQPIPLADQGRLNPAITPVPTGYFVAIATDLEMRGLFVGRDGKVEKTVTISTGRHWNARPRAVASTSRIAVLYNQPSDTYHGPAAVAYVSFSGEVTSRVALPGPLLDSSAEIAASGEAFLVVSKARGVVARTLTSPEERLVMLTTATQEQPEIACKAQLEAVIWVEERPEFFSGAVVMAIRRSGQLGPPITLTRAYPEVGTSPEISFNGESFLVVWYRYVVFGSALELVAARVSLDGELLDEPRVLYTYTNTGFGHAVANNGRDWLITFMGGEENRDLLSVRIASDGTLLDVQPRRLHAGSVPRANPALVFDGERYVVVWEDLIERHDIICQITCPIFYQGDVYALRLAASGEPIDSTPIAIAVGASDQSLPAVASRAGEALIVWQSDGGTDLRYAIRMNRLSLRSGVPAHPAAVDGVALSRPSVSAVEPAVSRSRFGYVVFWTEDKLAAAVVNGDQAIPLQLSSATGIHRSPALCGDFDEAPRIAYQRSTTEHTFGGATRLFLRDLVFPARRRGAAR